MSEPLISVVIPVFNGERFLAQTIESVRGQTWPRVELIVVDDSSTDGSAAIARSYPLRYLCQEHAGVAAARNRGLAAARGELISFLDHDDLWLPQKLERQVQCLLDNPKAEMCACEMEVFLQPGFDQAWLNLGWMDGSHLATQLGLLLVLRAVFGRVGGFDASYRSNSDMDWVLRARDRGVPIAFLREPLQLYRVHGENYSAGVTGRQRDTARALQASIARKRSSHA